MKIANKWDAKSGGGNPNIYRTIIAFAFWALYNNAFHPIEIPSQFLSPLTIIYILSSSLFLSAWLLNANFMLYFSCCYSWCVPPFFCQIFVYTIFFVYRHNKNQKNMDLFKFVPIEKTTCKFSLYLYERKKLFCSVLTTLFFCTFLSFL